MTSIKKTLIVLLDGTWQDGSVANADSVTNIWRMATSVEAMSSSNGNVQIVSYESGIGSSFNTQKSLGNYIEHLVEGITGCELILKIQNAYTFLATNWQEGDSIVTIGFSRGSYTARLVTDLVGAIGILDKDDLKHFGQIYDSYSKLNSTDESVKKTANAYLDEWRAKARAKHGNGFLVDACCCFDTVAALGINGILSGSTLYFGFNDLTLSPHVKAGYHAMALNENRLAYNIVKWEHEPSKSPAGQIVEQVWFAGSHSDIGKVPHNNHKRHLIAQGGGWTDGDLAYLSLYWMVSKLEGVVEFDKKRLESLVTPYRPYGQLPPHNALLEGGVESIQLHNIRDVKLNADSSKTIEKIHSSLQFQDLNPKEANWPESIVAAVKKGRADPQLIAPMSKDEIKMRKDWQASGAALPEKGHTQAGFITGFINDFAGKFAEWLAKHKN